MVKLHQGENPGKILKKIQEEFVKKNPEATLDEFPVGLRDGWWIFHKAFD